MKNQWIKDIQEKMSSHREPAPQGLWESIEADPRMRKPIRTAAYRRIFRISAATGSIAATVALLFWLAFHQPEYIEDTQKTAQTFTSSRSEESLKATTLRKPEPEITAGIPRYQTALQTPVRNTAKNRYPLNSHNTTDDSTVKEQPVQTAIKDTTGTGSPKTETVHYHSLNEIQGKMQPEKKHAHRTSAEDRHPYRSSERSAGDRFTVSLLTSNLTSQTRKSNGYGEFVRGMTLPGAIPTNMDNYTPGVDVLFANVKKQTQTEKKHHLPIRVGISASYSLNKYLSIESGIMYSYLAAELTTGSQENSFHTEQALQYLGIPVQMNLTFWQTKRFNFYLSAGGMIEKCIAGRSETEYILENRYKEKKYDKVVEKPCQFSVNGSVGAQVNITPLIGIFAEPGISYYFDNGSPVETIYKSKPLNFNLDIGVRFSF